MRRGWVLLAVATLAGCGFVNKYEEGVFEYEPVYCYQTLGGVQCFDEPDHADGQRLVNYYGPHPSRYDAPDKPEIELAAPDGIDTWVKDTVPVPVAANLLPKWGTAEWVKTHSQDVKPPVAKASAPVVWEAAPAARNDRQSGIQELHSLRITEPVAPASRRAALDLTPFE